MALLTAQEEAGGAEPPTPTRDLRSLPNTSGPGATTDSGLPGKVSRLHITQPHELPSHAYLGPGTCLPVSRRGCPVPGPLAEANPNRVREPTRKHPAAGHTGRRHVGRERGPGGRGEGRGLETAQAQIAQKEALP